MLKAGYSFAQRSVVLAVRKFVAIDGAQRAAAFAYYAFFSLFPLVVLFVSIGSFFVDRDLAAKKVVGYFENFAPIEPKVRHLVFDALTKVVRARGQLSAAAFVVLLWSALQFFKTLVRATNRAWDARPPNWWQMPLKSVVLFGTMGSALVLRIMYSFLVKSARDWVGPQHPFLLDIISATREIAAVAILFYCLCLLYRLSPRCPVRFSDVALSALVVSLLLRLLEAIFVIYLHNFSQLNTLYGTFGGIMALLLWIYVAGYLIIGGACLSSAHATLIDRKAR